jgi:hypothetical protein
VEIELGTGESVQQQQRLAVPFVTSQTHSTPVSVSLGSRAILSPVHQQVVYAPDPQTFERLVATLKSKPAC